MLDLFMLYESVHQIMKAITIFKYFSRVVIELKNLFILNLNKIVHQLLIFKFNKKFCKKLDSLQ